MGKKGEEEEVTSPMKDVQTKDREPSSVRIELFPAHKSTKALALTLHGEEKREGHNNSTMQSPLGSPNATVKEGEKVKTPCKFRRAKRDEQKGETAKNPGEKLKKKRSGDDLMEIEPSKLKEAKKAKCDKVDGAEEKTTTNEAGLSE